MAGDISDGVILQRAELEFAEPGQRQVEARELQVAEIEAQHLRVPARVLRELQKDMPRASNAARIEASVAGRSCPTTGRIRALTRAHAC